MTLQFNALVLIVTDHCNAACSHCYPACGPKKKGAPDSDLFKRCITQARNIPNLGKIVHLAGGEPFLYPKEIMRIAEHAFLSGFSLSAVTNGFWGKDRKSARARIALLHQCGLARVELSTDLFHQEYIGIDAVRGAIEVLKEFGIAVVLRVITSRVSGVDDTLKLLGADALDGIQVAGSPLVPVGRALSDVDSKTYYLSETGALGACARLLNLTVRPDGNVSPCCAGSDVTPSLSLGNLHTASLDEIVRRAEWNYLIQRLVNHGPSSFFEFLQDADVGYKAERPFTNICHACTDMFGSPENVKCISHRIKLLQEEAIFGKKATVGSTLPETEFLRR